MLLRIVEDGEGAEKDIHVGLEPQVGSALISKPGLTPDPVSIPAAKVGVATLPGKVRDINLNLNFL